MSSARPLGCAALAAALLSCNVSLDRSGLRSVCEIPLQRRSCVFGDVPLVEGEVGGGPTSGRTDCRLFDGAGEVPPSSYRLVPLGSELCEGARWHVELDVDVELASDRLFLVCRNDQNGRCPAPPDVEVERTCAPEAPVMIAPPSARRQFLVSLVGDETGGLLVWAQGEPGGSSDGFATWLDGDGLPLLAAGAPVAPQLLQGLPGASMRGGRVVVPLSGDAARSSFAAVEAAFLEPPQPIQVLSEPLTIAETLPFGEIDRFGAIDAASLAALAPSQVRLALGDGGRVGAAWVQGLIALRTRTDEVYRAAASRSRRGEPAPLGSSRPDASSGPVVARGEGGWGVAFAESFRVGATGIGLAWLDDSGRRLRAPRFVPGVSAAQGMVIAPVTEGRFVVASLADDGQVSLILFKPEDTTAFEPVQVDRLAFGGEYVPKAIALAPLAATGDLLLAGLGVRSAGAAGDAYRVLFRRLAPGTTSVRLVGGEQSVDFPDTGLLSGLSVCAATDGSFTRVVWAVTRTAGSAVNMLDVTALPFTDLSIGATRPLDQSTDVVRHLGCDGSSGGTVAVWTTANRLSTAWFVGVAGPAIERDGRFTAEDPLSVSLLPDLETALVGRAASSPEPVWYLRRNQRPAYIGLPVESSGLLATAGPIALAARRELGDRRVLAVFDRAGPAGGPDRDVVAVSATARDGALVDVGAPVTLSAARGLPLFAPRVTSESPADGAPRFAFLATLELPGGSGIVVDREGDPGVEGSASTVRTFTLGAGTVGARVAAAIPEASGLRILVDDFETVLATTLPSEGASPERTRPLWTRAGEVDASCPSPRPFGLGLTRVDGIEISAFAVQCAPGEGADLRLHYGLADDRGVPFGSASTSTPLAQGVLWADESLAPPALAARVGRGMSIVYLDVDGAVMMRRISCRD